MNTLGWIELVLRVVLTLSVLFAMIGTAGYLVWRFFLAKSPFVREILGWDEPPLSSSAHTSGAHTTSAHTSSAHTHQVRKTKKKES